MRYEVYHSNKAGNIFATSRTRRTSAIRIAEKITLSPGEKICVFEDQGPMPGDCNNIYTRKYTDKLNNHKEVRQ